MNIEIPPSIEHALLNQAAEAGKDVVTFVRQVLTESVEKRSAASSRRLRSHAEFMERIRRIIALHPASSGDVDDSRESIYAGCGE